MSGGSAKRREGVDCRERGWVEGRPRGVHCTEM